MKHQTTATLLNFRATPKIVKGNIITALPKGTLQEKTEVHSAEWWKVKVNLSGTVLEGFVAAKYLKKASGQNEPAATYNLPGEKNIPPVHLKAGNPKAARNNTRSAFHLDEPDMPFRKGKTTTAKVASLLKIIDFLNVEKSARYVPNSKSTYCNIYAYDYCLGVVVYNARWHRYARPQKSSFTLVNSEFFGRASLASKHSKQPLDFKYNYIYLYRPPNGATLKPVYGVNVFELNANSLLDWLKQYGKSFGWERKYDLNSLQQAANLGHIAIIAAANKNSNSSGHLSIVAPEHKNKGAIRNAAGTINSPLQSQAGRVNKKFFTGNWWEASGRFREFGFWVGVY